MGVSFQTTPIDTITHTQTQSLIPRHNHSYPQFTHWGWFLKTYPRVRILTYSPRTGTRSKCLQTPWGVILTMEPNHLRRLQDAVGLFSLTTTNKQISTVARVLHTRVYSFPDHNAGRRTDFWDKKSSDFSGEIFRERNYCPRTAFSGKKFARF